MKVFYLLTKRFFLCIISSITEEIKMARLPDEVGSFLKKTLENLKESWRGFGEIEENPVEVSECLKKGSLPEKLSVKDCLDVLFPEGTKTRDHFNAIIETREAMNNGAALDMGPNNGAASGLKPLLRLMASVYEEKQIYYSQHPQLQMPTQQNSQMPEMKDEPDFVPVALWRASFRQKLNQNEK